MLAENLNTTINGTEPSSCLGNPTTEKIGKILAYCLIFLVSLSGNTFIGIIVYKTKTMRKPINFFIVNMAMSDMLYPIFMIPSQIQMIYIDSWLIGGPLGQVLCKLVHFFQETSFIVSIQSLVLIAVDRFGAVVFPLRSPLISSKLCPIFILATWMVAMAVTSPYLIAFKVVKHHGEHPGCEQMWNEAFGEHSSFPHISNGCRIPLYPFSVDSHTLHCYLFNAQVTEASRRAVRPGAGSPLTTPNNNAQTGNEPF